MNPGKEIQKKLYLSEYKHADNIIRYLLNPNDDTIELTPTEKNKLDICKKIHGYRCNYTSKRDVASLIVSLHGYSERQAYNLINDTEYIFGSIEGVNKDYERNFLLENSRKNIELAMASRDSLKITKALMAHYKLCGLEEIVPDLPDFSNLEQHNYIVNLPPQFLSAFKALMKSGSVNVADLLPPPDLSSLDDAQELKDDQ